MELSAGGIHSKRKVKREEMTLEGPGECDAK